MAVGMLELAAMWQRQRAMNAELDAFLRDEYRGRMPRATFLAMGLRNVREPRESGIGTALGGLVRAAKGAWRRSRQGAPEGAEAGGE